jgi:hypothetical protein
MKRPARRGNYVIRASSELTQGQKGGRQLLADTVEKAQN